jgi:hypothetical protein
MIEYIVHKNNIGFPVIRDLCIPSGLVLMEQTTTDSLVNRQHDIIENELFEQLIENVVLTKKTKKRKTIKRQK